MKENTQTGPFLNLIRIFFSYVFPAIFSIVGAILLIVGARNIQGAWESKDWPSVDGVMHEAEVKSHMSRSSNGRSRSSYTLRLNYSYSVDDKEYTGDRLRFGQYNFKRSGEAKKKAKAFAAGNRVKVYHDPEKPEESVLEPGMHDKSWLLPGLGALFFTIGTLMGIFLPRMMRHFIGQFTTVVGAALTARENATK